MNTELDINKIRERTFNKELSDLVTRIKSNEPSDIDNAQPSEDISGDQLLQMFHDIFYKSINLKNIHKINTDFNPFDLYKESTGDDLTNLINIEMQKISLRGYSILAYNVEKRCYTSIVSHITNLDENNIIVNPSEELYSEIIKSKNGIVLNPGAIERNFFLKKRFSTDKTYYLISFNNFFNDFYNDIDYSNNFSYDFFPILMIELAGKTEENNKKIIYNKIKTRLTVHFFLLRLLYYKNQTKPGDSKIPELQDFLNYLDYEYQKYRKNNDGICFVIKCKRYSSIDSLFILNYLIIKLKRKLSEMTTLYRIEKEKFIVFTVRSKKKILEDIVENFNKLYDNLFQVEVFMIEDNNKKYILQDIKKNILK